MSTKNHRSIYLPKEAWEDVEKIAVIEEKNAGQVVKEAVEKFLEDYKESKK
ncbi:hypothetical protein GF362_07395 [Candidatus Dojkabacteria bacterium]|nr:hypothetical protein [Candidatus Dojkabacteria bacterium]